MFSSRLPAALEPNRISREIAARRQRGEALLDLTISNPTRIGLSYPRDLLAPLADPCGLQYRPEPLGLDAAREAVAADYRRQGLDVPASRVALTAGTSEAYGLLFKLLCDPDDEVLVPQPSYPLFELLTSLEGVRPRTYRVEHHGVWSIDRGSLERAASPRTRAVLVVSPNNPTGSMLRAEDRAWLLAWCGRRGIAVIADEVFVDYPLQARADASRIWRRDGALTFSLGGLSKSAGLPQLKLAWIAVGGDDRVAAHALARIELIADTYLTVATPVQQAAGELMAAGAATRAAIARRVAGNLTQLRETVARHPSVDLLEPEGGWSAVLRVPASAPEEALVLRLLDEAGVIVQPGFFFDFAHEAFLVMSLLPEPGEFLQAIERLLPIVGIT